MNELRILTNGERVILVKDGSLVADMPWQAALELANAIYRQAKLAEELANAEEIVMDQAILMRAGAPFGLSGNADIMEEAGKEAAWNSDLRRYMPGGIRSRSVVGTPTIIGHPPKGD